MKRHLQLSPQSALTAAGPRVTALSGTPVEAPTESQADHTSVSS